MEFVEVSPKVEVICPPGVDLKQYFDGLLGIVELGGRNCYKTEHRIGDKETRNKFIKGIIDRGHLSVIEHGFITARLIGSRAMSHQLVRHRLVAYSQESQRYCNYTGNKFGDAIQVIRPIELGDAQSKSWVFAMQSAANLYEKLAKQGLKAEDARFVLPNASKTEVVMTTNFRVWRHIFNMRCDKHAQWEIRALMCTLLKLFQFNIPVIFDDFELNFPFDIEGKRDVDGGEEHVKFASFTSTSAEIIASNVEQIPHLVERRPD